MRRPFGTALCAVAFLIAAMVSAVAQSRVALVIGNSAYQSAPALNTAMADSGIVAETLRAAGYDVTELQNVRQADIGMVMRGFLDKVAAAGPQGVAFFYFAGYGAQFSGENFLVPVDARIGIDEDVAYEAFRLNDLLNELAQLPAAARIVILDAARDHGFGRGGARPVPPGLAIVDVPDGMLVAFSAAPGAVASDGQGAFGLYTVSLVTLMRQPGLDIEQMVKGARLQVNQSTNGAQVPWMASNLGVDLRLFEASAGGPPTSAPPVVAPPAGAPAAVGMVRIPPKGERALSRDLLRGLSADEAYQVVIEEDTLQGYQWFVEVYPQHPLAGQIWDIIAVRREAVLWRRTLAQGTRNAYWNYLKRYPDGAHAIEAQERLEALSVPRMPPPTYVPAPEPLPPDYYDEAVGLVDVVPQGFAPPPPVFDDSPPFFILPPPPRPPRPPIIIVRPPPPVIIVDGRRPPDIIVRPPRPDGGRRPGDGIRRPDGGLRPGDGIRPPDGGRRPGDGIRPPDGGRRPGDGIRTPDGGRRPNDGVRIPQGGRTTMPPSGQPMGPAVGPGGRSTTPGVGLPPSGPRGIPGAGPGGRSTTPGVGLPPSGLQGTPGTRPGGRSTTPGTGLPPGAAPGATPGATPGGRPGLPTGPGGRPAIPGVGPGGTPAGTPGTPSTMTPGGRPGLPPPTGGRPGLPPVPGATPSTPSGPSTSPLGTGQRPGLPPSTVQPGARPGVPPSGPTPPTVRPGGPPPSAVQPGARPGVPPSGPTPPTVRPGGPPPSAVQPGARPGVPPSAPTPPTVRPGGRPPPPTITRPPAATVTPPRPTPPRITQPPRPAPQVRTPPPPQRAAQPPRPAPQVRTPPPPQRAAPPPRPAPQVRTPPPPQRAAPPPRPAAPPPRAAPPPPKPAAPSCPAGTRNVGGRCVK